MKNFLAVYTGSAAAQSRWESLPEAERLARQTEGIAAWKAWGQQHHASVAETGGPLGRSKKVSGSGVADIRNALAAYTIVRAESHEQAAQLFVDHPHFAIFPGEGVEVMEILPVPGG